MKHFLGVRSQPSETLRTARHIVPSRLERNFPPEWRKRGREERRKGEGGGERERERKDAAPLRLVNNVSRDECFGSNRHKRTDVVHTCLPRRVLRYIYVRNVSARTEQDVRDTLALAG